MSGRDQSAMDSARDAAHKAGETVSDKAAGAYEGTKGAFERASDAVSNATISVRSRQTICMTGEACSNAVRPMLHEDCIVAQFLAHNVAEGAKGAAAKTGEVISDTAKSAKDGVCRAGHTISDTASSAYEKAKEAVGAGGK